MACRRLRRRERSVSVRVKEEAVEGGVEGGGDCWDEESKEDMVQGRCGCSRYDTSTFGGRRVWQLYGQCCRGGLWRCRASPAGAETGTKAYGNVTEHEATEWSRRGAVGADRRRWGTFGALVVLSAIHWRGRSRLLAHPPSTVGERLRSFAGPLTPIAKSSTQKQERQQTRQVRGNERERREEEDDERTHSRSHPLTLSVLRTPVLNSYSH